ncbi:hypothetical protein [Dyadobacter chenhuakuii]|uniref:Uncharacterized protein n=1 Tax=Dyadobacter chenhuakuii TaxID=2909339 RepID=A0ABY4XQB0_9BACT|nr:hypothetical protein [Dyadobacter chenhuakuii]MCF2493084.1 hypothetical protein [Dyadobacter chenhuakuii]USJ32629.1 hypothetical protein NFI80_07755 [Dyadobacter chenhuakuii]
MKWRTSNGKTITIKKPGSGRAITAISVNGKENKGYLIPHDLFKNGGEVEIVTK